MARKAREKRLRRLYLEQFLGWATAWLLGLGILSAIAVTTHGRLNRQDLDAEMRLLASAVYGLAWIDANGQFQDEVLRREPGLLDGPWDVWVIEPGLMEPAASPEVHLAPTTVRYEIAALAATAAEIVTAEAESYFVDGRDDDGQAYRLHGTTSYDDNDLPRAAILIVADPAPWRAEHAAFIRETALAVVALAAAGLLVGSLLSRRALRPVLASLEQQERFLAAAAHELRTPVASLRAVCESPGDAEETVEQVSGLVQRTGRLVDELLLLARLDSGTGPAAGDGRSPVRLDLLAEAVLPEDGSVRLDATESVVDAEPALVETALRNLVENARLHGGEPQVTVREARVVVEDNGPGFSSDLLERADEPFVSRPGSPGTGLGLAIVRLIAERHGGRLVLENRPQGGARVTLGLGRFS